MKKYLKQYVKFMNTLNNHLETPINLEMKEGEFLDDKVQFGYLVYHLEKCRVEKISAKIIDCANQGFEDMYLLGLSKQGEFDA